MRVTISFDDVLLKPKFSSVMSRKDIDIASCLDDSIKLEVPIISAPMDTVTEDQTCSAMANLGGLGIIHRYNSIQKQCELVKLALHENKNKLVGASVGVSGDFIERAQALVTAGARVICIDIAHGHHALMRYALQALRSTLGHSVHIMAGNVATREGYEDLVEWGASSVKVGIGGGSICSTRIQTGHGVPTLQSVLDCAQSEKDIPIIADGGIRNSGDIVKALAAGADFVMLGSLLAGSEESPGKIIHNDDGKRYKIYRGMASKEAQIDWRGHTASIEGVSSRVRYRGPIKPIIEELVTGIRSGLSYSGVENISLLQATAVLQRQTHASSVESSTHINLKKGG